MCKNCSDLSAEDVFGDSTETMCLFCNLQICVACYIFHTLVCQKGPFKKKKK